MCFAESFSPLILLLCVAVQDQFLLDFDKFVTEKMMRSIHNLFKPSDEISMDQKYQILEEIKTSIIHSEPEPVQSGYLLSSYSWRFMILFNFVASQDVETNHRLLEHLLGDFEDLIYTNSIVNNNLARISLRVLRKNLRDSPKFINNSRTMLH